MKQVRELSKADITSLITSYKETYAKDNKPIEVNFRQMFPSLNKLDRYTHLIHAYPAKLLCHIPYFFLQTDDFCPRDGVVLDPFCGTGTVLLEAAISGRTAYGADANPLARKITKSKLTYISDIKLKKLLLQIQKTYLTSENVDDLESVEYIRQWFSDSVLRDLYKLHLCIERINDRCAKDFFGICFSSLLKKVSLADPHISVPVHLNPERFMKDSQAYKNAKNKLDEVKAANVLEKFIDICRINIGRLQLLSEMRGSGKIVSEDARTLKSPGEKKTKMPDNYVDLILTSPPYAGAQKYIRSSRLNLFWMGCSDSATIHTIAKRNIGREDYHKHEICRVTTGINSADKVLHDLYDSGKCLRSYVVGNYLLEMMQAIDESIRVLKEGGYFVMVIGNNTVCGEEFNTQEYLSTYLSNKGLDLQFKLIDDIKSYGLMTKRNKTANRISREWIIVFKK